MKKRKSIILFVVMALCLMLSACNSGKADENKNESTGESSSQQESQQLQESQQVEDDTEVQESEEVQESQSGDDVQDETAGLTGTYPNGSTPEYSGVKCRLTVDGEEIIIAMYDNTAADAFLQRLPLTDLSFYDLSGVEKPVEQPEVPFSLGDEEPGYDPIAGEMVIYRPWGNFTIFYGDFRHSDELVPLGKVESGLEILAGKTEDFTGTLEIIE